MKGFRMCLVVVAIIAFGAATTSSVFAQGDGRFTGIVLDQSGAFVPGATVTVRNERTGEERVVTSNAQGRYVVSNLRPSSYTIRVTFGSFAPLEYTVMTLVAAQGCRSSAPSSASGSRT